MVVISKNVISDIVVETINDLNDRKKDLEVEKSMLIVITGHLITEDFVKDFIQHFLHKDYTSFINRKRFFLISLLRN